MAGNQGKSTFARQNCRMIYLLSAILTSTLIILGFKVFEKLRIDTVTAITTNYLIASGLGFWLAGEQVNVSTLPFESWFPLSMISGVLLIATFYVYASSAQKSGIAITAVSGKMSVVIPVLLGFIWYNDDASWTKIAGIILAMLAFWLTFRKKNEKKERIIWLLPLLLFLGNGMNDSVFKIAEEDHLQDDFIYFLATAFAASLILGLIVLFIRNIRTRMTFSWKSIVAGVVLGIVNWYSTYFFLQGLHHFDVSLFVPVFNVSIVLGGALGGYLLFREKLRPVNWIGILLAIGAITLMAF